MAEQSRRGRLKDQGGASARRQRPQDIMPASSGPHEPCDDCLRLR